MSERRVEWVDTLRGMAILSVVVGHCPGVPDWLVVFVYSFHIPLLFLLSGYVAPVSPSYANFFSDLKRRCADRVLIPFVVFYVVSYGYWLLVSVVVSGSGTESPLYPLSVLWPFTYRSFEINYVLWFFPCFLVVVVLDLVIYPWLVAHKYGQAVLGFALLVLCVGMARVDLESRWWFCADSALFGYLYFYGGRLIKRYNVDGAVASKLCIVVPISFLSFLVGIALCFWQGRVDINGLLFPKGFLASLATFVFLFLFFFTLSLWYSGNRFLTSLSLASIVVFPLHPLFFSATRGVGMIFFELPYNWVDSVPVFLTMIALVGCLLCYPAFRRVV